MLVMLAAGVVAGRGPRLARPRRGHRRRALLPRRPRRHRADRRPGPRPVHPALPALSGLGGDRRAGRAARQLRPPAALRAGRGPWHRHRRPRLRVGLVAADDADPLADRAAPRGRRPRLRDGDRRRASGRLDGRAPRVRPPAAHTPSAPGRDRRGGGRGRARPVRTPEAGRQRRPRHDLDRRGLERSRPRGSRDGHARSARRGGGRRVVPDDLVAGRRPRDRRHARHRNPRRLPHRRGGPASRRLEDAGPPPRRQLADGAARSTCPRTRRSRSRRSPPPTA